LARQPVVERGASEALDRGAGVVHPHRDAGALEVVHLHDLRGAAAGRLISQRHHAGAGNFCLGRAIYVPVGVATDDDRLGPVRHQAGDVAADDRLAEDRAVEDVADGAVRAAPHLLQLELLDARLVGRDRRAFHADAVLLDGVRRVDRHLVVGLVAVLDPKVEILQVHVEIGEDQLVLDETPDDARHLVPVQLDDGVLHLDLGHAILSYVRRNRCGRPERRDIRTRPASRQAEPASMRPMVVSSTGYAIRQGPPHRMSEEPSFVGSLATRNRDAAMKTGQRRGWLGRAAIIVSALVLVALTWFGTVTAVDAERSEARAHVEAEVSNQALVFEDQLAREFLVLEQTLRILEHEWEDNPLGFDLQEWRQRVLVLRDISLHIFITDANGIIRASTRPELIGVDVSGRDYFRTEAALDHDDGRMFIGPSTRGLVTNRWQMNMARRLDGPNGRFLGVLGLSYDTGSLTRFYRQIDLGEQGMIALVGVNDGRLRALVGPVSSEPGLDISTTKMFAALRANPNGHWAGPSPLDGVQRFHAFRAVPDRDLAVVVGFDAQSAMRASVAFARGAHVFAGGTTLFILVMAGGLLRELGMGRRREDELNRDRATLAAANAELDTARRRADAKAAQLEATLGGMSDGVSMLDPDLRLVAWNRLFADFTGVP